MSNLSDSEKEKRAKIINQDYGGIIPYCEVFYLHSIFYSANMCLSSFEQFEHYKTEEIPPEYLISIVQEAVGHSAALSRYFWPTIGRSKFKSYQTQLRILRGEKLRKVFGLTDDSVLYDRELRNAWEHFDERLDRYLLEQNAGQFYPDCIMDSHSLVDEPVSHIFKLLDIDEECLVLMNHKYFFSPIRKEVESIFNLTVDLLNNGGRLIKKE